MSDDQRIHRQSPNSAKEKGENSLSRAHENGEPRSAQTHYQKRGLITKPKVALVHDWLNGMRGGEIVFEALLDLYPDADVYTLVYSPDNLSKSLCEKLSHTRVHTSIMNFFPFSRKYYRQLLPFLPLAIHQFNLKPYDLVISSSHCVAKGVKKRKDAFHLSYIHAPMRYMWDRFDDYFGKGRMNPVFRMAAILFRPLLQWWDKRTAKVDRIDTLLANSDFIKEQIWKCYGRESTTVYPFAKLDRFQKPRREGNFYLMVGAFAPYKRTDIAIEAFARLGLPLKIVGQGQDEAMLIRLRDQKQAKNIEMIKFATNDQIENLYAECKAFVFPGKEDFGITPLEAMASGAPIIAFDEGGASETVTKEAGILFKPQSIEALSDAVMEIESGRKRFDPEICKARAKFFTEKRFKDEILKNIPTDLHPNELK